MTKLSCRQAIARSTTAVATAASADSPVPLTVAAGKQRFRIGACDWSIGKMASPDALKVAGKIGLDGVQVSLSSLANDMHLRNPEVQRQYREAARKFGVVISSLAILDMNNISFANDPRPVEWINDCMKVMQALDVKVVLLPFFGRSDFKGDKAGADEVVARLKSVAPKAKNAGVVLGIESWLSADEHMDLIDRVGSPAVKVYYDVCNAEKMGYDIYKEIRRLGRKHICELHAKENGFLLGQGQVDFKKVRAALDDIGYAGWMQIEGAVPKGATMLKSYIANFQYLRSVFPKDA